jgi:hypothetical protein
MVRSEAGKRRGGRVAACALGMAVMVTPAATSTVAAQDAGTYMDYDALTSTVRGLEGDLVRVSSLATSSGRP